MSKESKMHSKLQELYDKYQKLIPDVNKGHLSYDLRLQEQLKLNDKGDIKDYELRARFVEEQLLYSGISPELVEFIMDKFVSNLSYDDIAKKYGYRNRHQVRRIYQKIIAVLKANQALKLALKSTNIEKESF